MSDAPPGSPAVVIRPGDHVLVGLHNHTGSFTPEQAEQMRQQLEQEFPGVRFALVSGVTALAAYRHQHGDPPPDG